MRLPQLKAAELLFLLGILIARCGSGFAQEPTNPGLPVQVTHPDKEITAPVVPNDVQVRILEAQKKISDLNVQLLQLQRQAEQQGTQLSAQLEAAVKEGQTACGDEKKWVFDRDTRTCKAVEAQKKASGPPTPETQAKR